MSCTHAVSRWTTMEVRGRPQDVRRCVDCGKGLTMSPLHAPLRPIKAECCANCGAPRLRQAPARRDPSDTVRVLDLSQAEARVPRCTGCGKTRAEDLQLHRELLGKLGGGSYLRASEAATELGRNVLALKLATAGYHFGVPEDRAVSRAARMETLMAMNKTGLAEREAREWFGEPGCPPFVASLLAEVLRRTGDAEEARRVLDQGLGRDPDDPVMRAERAELLLAAGELEPAAADARVALQGPRDTGNRALVVLREVMRRHLRAARTGPALATFESAGSTALEDAELCTLRAEVATALGTRVEIRRWLALALQNDPNHAEATRALDALDARPVDVRRRTA